MKSGTNSTRLVALLGSTFIVALILLLDTFSPTERDYFTFDPSNERRGWMGLAGGCILEYRFV